jgi:hypothetical protein
MGVRGQLGQIVLETPSPKITRAKWNESVNQAVEHLVCKLEALSSNSRPTKQTNKQTKPQQGRKMQK